MNDSVAEVVEALSGSITESQLFTDLRTKIGLITDGKDVIGSVNDGLESLKNSTTSLCRQSKACRQRGRSAQRPRPNGLIH